MPKTNTGYKIAVFGSDSDHCSKLAYQFAYEVGRELAKRNSVVFTGGGGGVMEAASRGAYESGALTVGILPGDNCAQGNDYLSVCIPTGIGFARAQAIVNSVDGAILVEGGLGTREEAGYMYWLRKPTVAIASSGGTAADVAGKSLDRRELPAILAADATLEAVEMLFTVLDESR